MAFHCAQCRSTDVQVLADRRKCLSCGAFTKEDGTLAKAGASQEVIDEIVRRTHAG